MAEQALTLARLYQGWDNYQQLLIKTIEPLTEEQLAYRPGPRLRSIGENASHIVGTRAGWFHFNLHRGDESLLPWTEWYGSPDQPAHSAAEIIRGLEFTWQIIQDTLNQWTTDDLEEPVIDTDDNGQEYTLTRQWVIWHVIEHDMIHGGEISLALSILGLPGIAI